jgi:hypothetical protein
MNSLAVRERFQEGQVQTPNEGLFEPQKSLRIRQSQLGRGPGMETTQRETILPTAV